MKKTYILACTLIFVLGVTFLLMPQQVHASNHIASTCTASTSSLDYAACTTIQTSELGFQIPSLGDILTFAIRAFFVIAGLAALFYLLLGALGWVTSGGDKDAVTAAREKIQAAVVGMILIVGVLAIIWTLEQVIFKRRICLGLSCPLTLPGLIEVSSGSNCCVCPDSTTGKITSTSPVVDTFNSGKCL